MGGYGSGRRGGKDTTDDYRALDVRRLERDGLLQPGWASGWNWLRRGETVASIQIRSGADYITLAYRHRSNGCDWVPINCRVRLDWTPCALGGRRAWFICPAKGCGRRVAILYSGSIFACRHCHKLVYTCQRERDDDRAMRRAGTIRKRLGWCSGIANPPGDKPKGMHWHTYNRLLRQYHGFALATWEGIAKRFGLMDQRIAKLGANRSNDD